MQNRIIKGRDNPVGIIFKFSGDFTLLSFTEITVTLNNETYSSNTDAVTVVNGNKLRINIGDITSATSGRYMLEIVGFNATYDDGYLLSGECNPILEPVIVC